MERPVYLDKWESVCNGNLTDCIWHIADYLRWMQSQIKEIEADCSVDKSDIIILVVNDSKKFFNMELLNYKMSVEKIGLVDLPKFEPFLMSEDFEVDATPDIR